MEDAMRNLFLVCLLCLSALPCRAAGKIVSLMPAFTEILFSIGASSQVAGVSNYCDWPPEAAKLPRVGDLLAPDIEKMASLKPAAVLIGKWKSSQTAERLKKAGLKVYELPDAGNIGGIYANILAIGEVAGRRKEAAALVARLKAETLRLKKTIPARQRLAGIVLVAGLGLEPRTFGL